MTTAFCTVFCTRELPAVRVLMRSLERFHPGTPRLGLLVDEVEGRFDPAREPFTLVEIRHLPLPEKQSTLFFYDLEEARAAVKPTLFGWLFDTLGMDEAVYLDPRTRVYGSLEPITQALARQAPLVATPHMLRPRDDTRVPGEFHLLRWGALSGALLAMSRHGPEAPSVLDWWQRRAYRHFMTDPERGPYRDQRWLDLAATRWNAVILRDQGVGGSFLNVHERPLSTSGGQRRAGADPLLTVCFDGLTEDFPGPAEAAEVRGHLDPGWQQLVGAYRTELEAAGHGTLRNARRVFDHFTDGNPIHPVLRRLYQTDVEVRTECGDDPFRTGPPPFNRPRGDRPEVSRLVEAIWRSRPDLQKVFPDPSDEATARRLGSWFVESGRREYGLGEAFTGPIRRALEAPGTPGPEAAPASSHAERPSPDRPSRGLAARLLARGLVTLARERLDRAPLVARFRHLVPRLVSRTEHPIPARPTGSRLSTPPAELGLNVAGYVTADLGVGQSARSAAVAAEAAGLPVSVIDFAVGTTSPKTDRSLARRIAVRNAHPVNLIHVNADQIPVFRRTMGPSFFEGKYNIAYWHWELPELPDEWRGSFSGLDEIWVPTQFVQAAVSAKSPIPVVTVPHAVSFQVERPSRSRFGLPEEGFLFLTMYDLLSFQERKNPKAALEAFRRAFGGRGDVALVVKVLNSDRCPEDMAALRESLADAPSAHLLPRTLSRQDVYDLEATCDAFVSLHRSEGFGLGLAECMFLGKPVIGTAWSGNVDFMTTRNSCPVDYDLVTLDRDHGPYRKGQRWADPDVDHAAWHMRRLVEDPALGARLGERARATLLTDHSPMAIGQRYRARLQNVGF